MTDPAEIHRGSIPPAYLDILQTESFGHVATVGPTETVHNTPVWTDHDGTEAVLFNTLRGRRKERDLRANPTATVSVTDPENPYRYLSVRGPATLSTEGAVEHIDSLARQYLGVETYPHHDEESEPRVVVRIDAEHVVARGRSRDR